MSENWTAVSSAINQRVHELGLRQRELAEKSQVSQAIVRELQQNKTQRRRGSRTLEALSVALQWHPQHLEALLRDRRPPLPGEPREDLEDPVSARLTKIEDRLAALTDRLSDIQEQLDRVLRDRRDGHRR